MNNLNRKSILKCVIPTILMASLLVLGSFSLMTIHLDIDGEIKTIRTFSQSAEALQDKHISQLGIHDQLEITHDKNRQTTVTIHRGNMHVLKVDGNTKTVSSTAKTVANLLVEQGIDLNPLDQVTPALNEPLSEPTTVKVTRVIRQEHTDHITVLPETEYIADHSKAAGVTHVIQQPQPGEVIRQVLLTLEDRIVTQRTTLKREVIKEAVPGKVAYGTRTTSSVYTAGYAAKGDSKAVAFDTVVAYCQGASKQYGIPASVLIAIAEIESDFRPYVIGPDNYTGENALGMMQFLPSTWQRYGVDADGDGVKDPFNPKDAVYSAANYLAANYEKSGSLKRAIWHYNHADWYVEEVLNKAKTRYAKYDHRGDDK